MMKVRSSLAVVVVLAALLACGGSGGGGNGPSGQPGGWTVLVYVMADNNLEPFAIENLNQMAQVGSGNGLRIAVQLDRSGQFSAQPVGSVAASQSVKRLLVQKNGFDVVQDLGDLDSADPATLADFIRWGVKTYPAQRYALVLWDHGGDWLGGFGQDGSHGNRSFSVAALASGISSGLQQAGLPKLSILGFDACLMATFEVAESLKGTADYLLASEETEPGAGWDYGAFTALQGATAPDPVAVARAIADAYRTQNGQDPTITLSLTDLNQLGDLETALTNLNAQATPQLAAQAGAVGQSRARALEFGRQAEPTRSMNQVDLGDLMRRLAAASATFAPVQQAVQAALSKAVVYAIQGAAQAGASGLSVYFPPSADVYQKQAPDTYRALPRIDGWRSFLEAYLAVPSAAPAFASRAATRTAAQGGSTVSATLASPAAGVADATLTYGFSLPAAGNTPDEILVFGDQPATLSGTTVSGTWDQSLLQLTQGATSDFGYLSLQDQGNGVGLAVIPLAYIAGAGDCNDPSTAFVTRQLAFDTATGQVRSDRYYQYQNNTAGELTPAPGSGFEPLYYSVVGTRELTQPPTSPSQFLCTGTRFDATQAIGIGFKTPSLSPGIKLFAELDVNNPAGQGDFAFVTWSTP